MVKVGGGGSFNGIAERKSVSRNSVIFGILWFVSISSLTFSFNASFLNCSSVFRQSFLWIGNYQNDVKRVSKNGLVLWSR